MTNTPAALEAIAVSYHAGGRALVDCVSLALRPGEIMALVGPNGAGKSTLLRLMAGDLAPAGGEVRLNGRPLRTYRPRDLALRRAVLSQQAVLQFAFTAREVVLLGRAPHGGGGRAEAAADFAVAEAALARTETLPLAERSVLTLSGGEGQRVQLARVLAQAAPVLLLDEPTAALDIRHQELVMRIARSVASAGGTVLAVLHDLNLAAAHADRIAVLRGGRLAALGDPWTALRADLLSSVFEYPLQVQRHPSRACPLVVPLPGADVDWLSVLNQEPQSSETREGSVTPCSSR